MLPFTVCWYHKTLRPYMMCSTTIFHFYDQVFMLVNSTYYGGSGSPESGYIFIKHFFLSKYWSMKSGIHLETWQTNIMLVIIMPAKRSKYDEGIKSCNGKMERLDWRRRCWRLSHTAVVEIPHSGTNRIKVVRCNHLAFLFCAVCKERTY